jgi:hypothetical protein
MFKNRRVKLRLSALILSGYSILAVALIVACSKDASNSGNEEILTETIAIPSTFNFNCTNSPVYEDSILCAKFRGPGQDYCTRPLNRPDKGKYYAWPAGLVIDVNTGAINVTQSEAGMQYVIGYVKDGTTDTCHTRIIVAGVTYKDNVYVLDNNDTLATPYFNANPLIQSVCDASGDDDYPGGQGSQGGGNSRCEFDDDEDDDNGNGVFDEPPIGQQANEQFVRVRTQSGIINLKKSLEDGAFGPNPQNGTIKDVRIYYRLNDCSQKALRSIKVRLIYYEKKTDIPQPLLTEVMQKKLAFESYDLISSIIDSPRPPLIIVARTEF